MAAIKKASGAIKKASGKMHQTKPLRQLMRMCRSGSNWQATTWKLQLATCYLLLATPSFLFPMYYLLLNTYLLLTDRDQLNKLDPSNFSGDEVDLLSVEGGGG